MDYFIFRKDRISMKELYNIYKYGKKIVDLTGNKNVFIEFYDDEVATLACDKTYKAIINGNEDTGYEIIRYGMFPANWVMYVNSSDSNAIDLGLAIYVKDDTGSSNVIIKFTFENDNKVLNYLIVFIDKKTHKVSYKIPSIEYGKFVKVINDNHHVDSDKYFKFENVIKATFNNSMNDIIKAMRYRIKMINKKNRSTKGKNKK